MILRLEEWVRHLLQWSSSIRRSPLFGHCSSLPPCLGWGFCCQPRLARLQYCRTSRRELAVHGHSHCHWYVLPSFLPPPAFWQLLVVPSLPCPTSPPFFLPDVAE